MGPTRQVLRLSCNNSAPPGVVAHVWEAAPVLTRALREGSRPRCGHDPAVCSRASAHGPPGHPAGRIGGCRRGRGTGGVRLRDHTDPEAPAQPEADPAPTTDPEAPVRPEPEPPTPTQPDPEPTPTTEPPTSTQLEPEPEPTPSADSPCTSPAVVDQALDALVGDCETLWDFYLPQEANQHFLWDFYLHFQPPVPGPRRQRPDRPNTPGARKPRRTPATEPQRQSTLRIDTDPTRRSHTRTVDTATPRQQPVRSATCGTGQARLLFRSLARRQ